MERTVYQSFEIDSAQTINLKVVGDFELKYWAGNSILTETNVQIWKASPNILDYFIEQGRYEILATVAAPAVTLTSKNMERKPIKTKDGECTEIISVRIFVPEDFAQVANDKTTLRKKQSVGNAPDSQN